MLPMWELFNARRYGPIGLDLGSRSVKLVQFNADRTKLVAVARKDLPHGRKMTAEEYDALLVQAIRQAQDGQEFRGRDAVVCLGARELFVQNIRVPKLTGDALEKMVAQEVASRIPFAAAEAEIRFLEAEDVRQGDAVKREIVVLACHRPVLERALAVVEQAGLRPVAVDVEPVALVRCYARQFRREDDKQQRTVFVHVGATNTAVVIARGDDALFVKYIDVGGKHLDDAVASHLKMNATEAATLRRHNGDRRSDQQDSEVARSVAEAARPVIDRLAQELALCIRYYSVTFRGQPLSRMVLSGGEASPTLSDWLRPRLDLICELGEPLRTFEPQAVAGRKTQWDVAAGLALRQVA
jgi:type IV pilus assembly protein PilM